MSAPLEVFTDLNPDELTEVAVETYRLWLRFALGEKSIGGRTLAHPSGRYAAAISWRRKGRSTIAIIADEQLAPEALWIEDGHSPADILSAMLSGGKVSADGHRYRRVSLKAGTGRGGQAAPMSGLDMNAITTSSATGGGASPMFKTMWAERRDGAEPDRVRTMTDRPGAAKWQVPAFAPYAPAAILADMLRRDYSRAQ